METSNNSMNRGKMMLIVSLVAAAVIMVAALSMRRSLERTSAPELKKIRVQAAWMINGEFANICSALVNGYYADAGLDVELIPGGPSGASFILATKSIAQNSDLDIGVEGDLIPLLRGRTKELNEQLKVK